jgi:hypothetical protein
VAAATAGGEGVSSYSGDDAYDPAAGGRPALSLLAYAEASNLLAACEIVLASD